MKKRKGSITTDRSSQVTKAGGNSTLVFIGDAQTVSDGFRIALDAMPANADDLLIVDAKSGTHEE
ncbi:hypothetical protein [Bradyrhizobium elkanii]|uniref:hypothetical protein n=1 Tax=Bradyrhizobium elkanii TaxID=29448 RepID=UPI00114C92F5|nr:hypothetical protein [Bradyrhizobium elkanii]